MIPHIKNSVYIISMISEMYLLKEIIIIIIIIGDGSSVINPERRQ